MKTVNNIFQKIISLESLFNAWQEFRKDKQSKPDVQKFEFSLESNIFELHRLLQRKIYCHGPYTGFYIHDPKVRHIHKAIVRDRILHHAIFKVLNPIFEPTFINNSFSCRVGKGTHRGIVAVEGMLRQASRNYTTPCFALKCDIRQFFDSVDHTILLQIFFKRIIDLDARALLNSIVHSYSSDPRERERERVIPPAAVRAFLSAI